MSNPNRTAVLDEIEHLEVELKHLQDGNADPESPAYKEVERRLRESYQVLENL